MKMLRSVTAGAVATAMLATSAAPAMAQGHGGGFGGYGRPGYNQGWNANRSGHRGGDNTGAIVAGVIGVGILAAILSSSSKSNRNNGYANGYGSIRSDNDAAEACAAAAERQSGGNARTRSIDTVDAVGNAAYDVRGTMSVSSNGYDDRDARGFDCTVRQGGVQRVDFGGYANGY